MARNKRPTIPTSDDPGEEAQADTQEPLEVRIAGVREQLAAAREARLETMKAVHAAKPDDLDPLVERDNAACQLIHDLELELRKLLGA